MVPGTYNCLKIQDTGTGISKEIINNIFDPYFTTKGVNKGTGLGLSVVHGIVKNLNGEIFVESIEREGTTFEIYLPAMEGQKAKPDVKTDRKPMGDERILLVEDEPHVAKIESRMLERLGYQVVCKNDPKEALVLFTQDPDRFDLVMSDQTMPGITGDKLAKEILAVKPDLPVIICTGYSELMDGAQIKKLGIKAILMKPIILSELAQTIRSILDQSK